MNYFAHALPFFGRPYFMAGTAVPDWLTVIDRGLRLRGPQIRSRMLHLDSCSAQIAAGILQHLADDARFHANKAFTATTAELTRMIRETAGSESVLRPGFLAHLLLELLLDAALISQAPHRLAEYYRVLDGVDAERVERAVNLIAPRPTFELAAFFEQYRRQHILQDYLDDDRLKRRLDQVLRRTGMGKLPDGFDRMLSPARRVVEERRLSLLEGTSVAGFLSNVV